MVSEWFRQSVLCRLLVKVRGGVVENSGSSEISKVCSASMLKVSPLEFAFE